MYTRQVALWLSWFDVVVAKVFALAKVFSNFYEIRHHQHHDHYHGRRLA